MAAPVVFDHVWKKFRLGERHDSLRDLIPEMARSVLRRRPPDSELQKYEFWALEDVAFEVEQGEALGIIGPNGAGKSTVLKLLTRILRPSRGFSRITGRTGALIEIAAGFHPDLTGRENIYLQGAIMGMKRVEVARKLDAIVEFAGVGSFVDTQIKRILGMNARLGFAIAAHLDPEVLVIDEVLSVGDMTFQQKCVERMNAFKRQGVTIVFVSHNLQAVGALCDRAVFLKRRVQATGQTADVLQAYVRDSRPDTSHVQGAVRVASAGLRVAGSRPGDRAQVSPGARLRLEVTLKTSALLDDVTFGFLVHRSTDQLLVYDGNVHRQEICREALSGDIALTFGFSAHLVRGHYYVSLHAFENSSQTFLLPKEQVAIFAIDENRSWGGVSDVDLNVTLDTTKTSSLVRP